MNEIYKGFLFTIIIFIIWSAGLFFAGYFLRDRRAVDELNAANQQLAEQQLKYDELIRRSEERIRETEDRLRESNERISNIRDELFGKISDNGQTIKELSAIIEQIGNQKLNIQI